MCDQYHFMTELLNDKADGFLDELTPTIELSEEMMEGAVMMARWPSLPMTTSGQNMG